MLVRSDMVRSELCRKIIDSYIDNYPDCGILFLLYDAIKDMEVSNRILYNRIMSSREDISNMQVIYLWFSILNTNELKLISES